MFKRRSNWSKAILGTIFFWLITKFSFNQKSDRNPMNSFNKVKPTTATQRMDALSTLRILSSLQKATLDDFELNVPLNESRTIQKMKKVTSEAKELAKKADFKKPPNIFEAGDLGEMGQAVTMPKVIPPEVQQIYDDGWKKNSFNQYVSDLISVNRSLPDARTDYCTNAASNYSKNLPATSVIIIFHNEAWSTLLRSFHSILNRSPDHLITEVILVDDFSDLDHLKGPLDDYIKDFPKVKILRVEKREGLIRARIRGTVVAKGPVLTFLDAHIECTEGWLEPLLSRIAENPTNVVCPIIEIINDETLKYNVYRNLKQLQVGGFDWGLTFRWHLLPKSEQMRKTDPSEPTRSPTMAGGLFSIDKKFFEKLGTYDPEFDIWGAENLELSFKTWMCGGTLEIIPCSHVGHIFRKTSPYKWRPGVNVCRKNSLRLAEVWMDDYKKFFYARTGNVKIDVGDISQRIQLRKDLGCKSFKWYLDNVWPELRDPMRSISFGEIRNLGFGGNLCLDAASNKEQRLTMHNCHEQGANQYWEYVDGLIRRDFYIVQYDSPKIVFTFQRPLKSSQLWTYKILTKQLYQKSADKCLAMNKEHSLEMQQCIDTEDGQKWQLENLVESRLAEF